MNLDDIITAAAICAGTGALTLTAAAIGLRIDRREAKKQYHAKHVLGTYLDTDLTQADAEVLEKNPQDVTILFKLPEKRYIATFDRHVVYKGGARSNVGTLEQYTVRSVEEYGPATP